MMVGLLERTGGVFVEKIVRSQIHRYFPISPSLVFPSVSANTRDSLMAHVEDLGGAIYTDCPYYSNRYYDSLSDACVDRLLRHIPERTGGACLDY